MSSASVLSQRLSWSDTATWGRVSVAAIAIVALGEIALCFAFAGPIVNWAAAAVARGLGAPGALAAATIERAPRRVWATFMTVQIALAITVQTTGSNFNAIDSTDASFSSLGDVGILRQLVWSRRVPDSADPAAGHRIEDRVDPGGGRRRSRADGLRNRRRHARTNSGNRARLGRAAVERDECSKCENRFWLVTAS